MNSAAKNQVEHKCKEINKQLLANLDTATKIPLDVSSRVLYSAAVGPIEMGFRSEYMQGEFDEIIDNHRQQVYEKFDNRMVELGLRPAMNLEEFMGEEFFDDPKQSVEQLESYIKHAVESLKSLNNNQLQLPEEMLAALLEQKQEALAQLVMQHKNGEYAVTESEIKYHHDWYSKFNEYQSLFKD